MIYLYTEKYTPRVKYIVHHIFEKILCDKVTVIRDEAEAKSCDGPLISYSRKVIMQHAFNICPHGLVFQDGIRDQDTTVTEWNDTKIFFRTGDDKYDLPFDIFSASFFLLSRYEEYYGEKDELSRFKKESSLAYKNGFLDRPLVDEWAYMLESMLVRKLKYKPAEKGEFRMHSSVAIDNFYKYRYNSITLSIVSLIKKLFTGQFKSFIHQLRVRLFLEKDPYDNFDKILSFHNHTTLNPTFFVMIKKGRRCCHNIYTTFSKLRKNLRRNYTTGLHPSIGTYNNTKKARKELRKLEKHIVKQRVDTNMYDKFAFSLPVGYETLLKIGITDDYSMAYHDAIGFRASTCTPFRFYDIKHESKTRLMVHNLAITDMALKAMGVHHNAIEAAIVPIVNRVKNVNGQFCCCLTNRIFSNSGKWYGWADALEQVYKYASKLEVCNIKNAMDQCE